MHKDLVTSGGEGLSEEQVLTSRKLYGANSLSQKPRKGFFRQFLSSFGDPIIKILLVALAINILFLIKNAEWFESVGIAVAVFLATFVSTLSEYGSESAFIELQKSSANIHCRVKRKKGVQLLPISELVVGDLVLLQAGEKIPADGILISGKLGVDQSALNGESKEAEKRPSGKQVQNWDLTSENQLFRGSAVASGEGILQVERVGDNTFYGSMAKEMQDDPPDSPLKVKLNGLAKVISKIGYCAAILIACVDLFNSFFLNNGMSLQRALADFTNLGVCLPNFIHALTLAIAVVVVAVPEGLPMMITVVLSSNMFRMMKDNVMVRKLVGIETAGSINILFTDKTGTITKGKLQVVSIVEGNGSVYDTSKKCSPQVRRLLELSAYYNTGCVLSDGKPLGGNATDRALLECAMPFRSLSVAFEKRDSVPFDSTIKFSAVHITGQQEYRLVKGAPEKILPGCRYCIDEHGNTKEFHPEKIQRLWREFTKSAIRVIVVATSPVDVHEQSKLDNLTFVAMIGIRDDIRKEAPEAIAEVQEAGIQVVMITGDNKDTAIAIAREAGLLQQNVSNQVITSQELSAMTDRQVCEILPQLRVVARALPTDKSRLVRLAQSMGLVAGMTGDGINDAPALKRADVGFGMGSGTEVAKEASDIVILDNNFASIVKAVRYGRTIFKSIRKFIVFQLTMNLCAVGVTLIGPFIGFDSPVTVIQMLWVNIIMDTLAGLAFAGEPPLRECMQEKPKKREEPVLSKAMIQQIVWMGLYTIGLCIAFLKIKYFRTFYGYEQNPIYFLTAFFTLFIFCGVFNSFNARTHRLNLLAHLHKNRSFLFIMLLVIAVQMILIYFGGTLFRTTGLQWQQLRLVLLLSLTVIPVDFLRKLFLKLLGKNKAF